MQSLLAGEDTGTDGFSSEDSCFEPGYGYLLSLAVLDAIVVDQGGMLRNEGSGGVSLLLEVGPGTLGEV